MGEDKHSIILFYNVSLLVGLFLLNVIFTCATAVG